LTALGQVRAGSRLTAAMAQDVAPLSAYKSTNQSVTSSATLVNDSALAVPLLANAVYDFELVLGYNGASGAGNIKLAWVLPSGATIGYAIYGNTTGGSATDAPWVTSTSAQALGTSGTSTPVGAVLSGTVAVSGTPGTMQLQWAQNSSNGTATTVLAGSVLLAWQVQ
jgi:hypothetical protein